MSHKRTCKQSLRCYYAQFFIQNFYDLNYYIYSWKHVFIFRSYGWFNFDKNNDAKVKTHKKASYWFQLLVQNKQLNKCLSEIGEKEKGLLLK